MIRRAIAGGAAALIVLAIVAHALGDESLAEQLGNAVFLALVAAVTIPSRRDGSNSKNGIG